jgi:hypothetical protein
MYIGLREKYRCSCKTLLNLNFLNRFSKNTRITNFMKVRLVGDESLRAEGWTNMMKLTVALRDLANTLKKED